MAIKIHPTAIVDPKAEIGNDVQIEPYAVIEKDVSIGDGSIIGAHAYIAQGARIGKRCRIFHGASISTIPQDLKFSGEDTVTIIGDDTTIREFCTINRGTVATGQTVIGKNCLLMAYCHVAHDCVIGDYFVGANTLNLAGHVTIGHHVSTGGTAAVVQFRRIGDYAFIGAYSLVVKDIIPFAMVGSDPVRIADINVVGLRRNGFDETRRMNIKRAFRILFRQNMTISEGLQKLEETFPDNKDIQLIVNFAQNSRYGILTM